MSTKIRLARGGRKKVPYYRVVVADSRSRRDGKFIEQIGKYNPLLPETDSNRFIIDKERAIYWLGIGSKPTDRVAILMSKAGIKEADKYKPKFTPKKKGEGAKKAAKEAPATPPAEIKEKTKPEVKEEAKPEVKEETKKVEEKPTAETPTEITEKTKVEAKEVKEEVKEESTKEPKVE
ncbi:30S ribosomal protein S16 [Pseudomonadota bacterium]